LEPPFDLVLDFSAITRLPPGRAFEFVAPTLSR
jgi:hypothetical protein